MDTNLLLAARHRFRMLFDEATEYRRVSTLFLRLLALIYFAAFASVLPQITGLVGPGGILPLTEEFAYLESQMGIERFWATPTLFWLDASDWSLQAAALAGCLFSLLLFLNRSPRLSLIMLFLLYLSLVKAGQLFFNFHKLEVTIEGPGAIFDEASE